MTAELKEIALQLKKLNNKLDALLLFARATSNMAKKEQPTQSFNIGSEGDNEKTHSEK